MATSLQSVAKSIAARDWETAEKKLRVLRRRHPGRAVVSYNLALVVRERGRHLEALELLAETAVRFPDHAFASFELANTLLMLGREREARERLEHHVSRWTGDADAHVLLGSLWMRHGDTERAKQHLAAVDRKPAGDNHDVALLEAQVCLRDGDFERAWVLFERLARASPDMRPSLLKELTQAPRGRLPLDSRRLGWG